MARHSRRLRSMKLTFVMISCALNIQTLMTISVKGEAAEGGEDGSATTSATTTSASATKEEEEMPSLEDLDWGTFYDPKDVFCGKFDCYKILGFDHTTFHTERPTLKNITQSYRKLSRKYHPDKNKQKGAKERFVKIAKAYEILTDREKRQEYDRFRDRPDEYFAKYGSSVMWKYAPKSDASVIVFLLFVLVSLFVHFAQRQRWQTVADHVIKAAVEDWSTREGGSTDSQEIRRKALEILAEKEASNHDNGVATKHKANGGMSNRMAKKNARLQKHDKKKESQDELKKIVTALVHEIDDFGGGFHKPTWRDMFALKLLWLPLVLGKALCWRTKFYARRLLRQPYSTEERQIMTEFSVGAVAWEAASDEDREHMLTLELWESENLEEWREDQRAKLLSVGDQKKYARMKKKQKKES